MMRPHALSRVGMGFVLLLGVVSLFADMAYEGARSITGPFLASLGANASVVGFVAGLGEVMGYALRLPSGFLADRTRRYWDITILGYLVNMGAVPLLALAGRWETASALIVAERIGKAVRTPARDAMLAYAAASIGRGWAFGVHEAIDQVGAVAGPLVVAAVLALTHGYRWGFGVLAVPAALALLTLALARWRFPNPLGLEAPKAVASGGGAGRFPLPFWLYLAFTGVSIAGYAHFQMVGYHLKVAKVVTDAHIPLLFALAMGVDAVTALLIGRWFDRVGLRVLALVPLLSLPIVPLTFSHTPGLAVAGVLLWGIVLGAHETVLRAAVASFAPVERRGAAFGVFHAVYGVAWFAGSATMGALYPVGIGWLVAFSVILEVVALALLVAMFRDAGWGRAQPADGV
ncbi:MAG: MFS transporter [Dehalococcoidia bacterium]